MLEAWSGDGEKRKNPAHPDAEDHDARADQDLRDHRDADGIAHRRHVAHRVVARHLVRRGGNRQAERQAERDQLTPAEPPAGDARVDRVRRIRRAPSCRRRATITTGSAQHQRQHHDQRLHELDVRARADAAERGVEAGAGQQRHHRDQRRDAEDRRRDLADRLELCGEEDGVGDDDQHGGQRARAFAGETLPDVIGDRQRAEATQFRRDEDRRDQPSGPDPEPDPDPADAGQIMPPSVPDEGAGADLRRGEHGAADPRTDDRPAARKSSSVSVWK